MKKVMDWFDLLPEKVRHKAFAETVSLDRLNTRQPSFWDAMACAFTWNSTVEGHNYWSDIAKSFSNEPK